VPVEATAELLCPPIQFWGGEGNAVEVHHLIPAERAHCLVFSSELDLWRWVGFTILLSLQEKPS